MNAASAAPAAKPYKGMAMEGFIARWYARNTEGSLAEFRDLAKRIAGSLVPGARVLEVAPGPGYLAIELAKLGLSVTGVDISRSFVEIARERASEAGVRIEFREGNASALPFAANAFDFLVSRAAFKNFGDPAGALREMHRVLKPGATALVIDMRKAATNAEIASEVAKMNLGFVGGVMTRGALRSLRRRAYTKADFEKMLAGIGFSSVASDEGGIGSEVTLTK